MTDVDENVNHMLGTNDEIARALAKRAGREMAEQLLDALKDPELKSSLDALRADFGIKVNPDLSSEEVDQYLVDAVSRKLSGPSSVQDIGDFIRLLSIFNTAFDKVIDPFNVDVKLHQVLKVYIAKEKVSSIDCVHGLVRVEMNKTTKDLVIRISSKSRSSSDLKDAVPHIYKSWDTIRKKPNKFQPSPQKERDSEIARYRKSHSRLETIDKFSPTGAEMDAIEKALYRNK
jgi:hypothetical protein